MAAPAGLRREDRGPTRIEEQRRAAVAVKSAPERVDRLPRGDSRTTRTRSTCGCIGSLRTSFPTLRNPICRSSTPRLDSRSVRRKIKTDGNRARTVEREVPPLLSQHADHVNPWEFAGFLQAVGPRPFDVMLKAKMKDAPLSKLRGDLQKLTLVRERKTESHQDEAAQ